jgi:hypothetical protein
VVPDGKHAAIDCNYSTVGASDILQIAFGFPEIYDTFELATAGFVGLENLTGTSRRTYFGLAFGLRFIWVSKHTRAAVPGVQCRYNITSFKYCSYGELVQGYSCEKCPAGFYQPQQNHTSKTCLQCPTELFTNPSFPAFCGLQ